MAKMETKVEADRTGTPVRIFHTNERYTWTHPMEERTTCTACTNGTLPPEVRNNTKRSTD